MISGLVLEEAIVKEDAYIQWDVREATIGLLRKLKQEHEGRAGFILVLGYCPETDRRYVSAMKRDYLGEARQAARAEINVKDDLAYRILSIMAQEDDDGAVLIDDGGNILNSGYRLRPDPEDVLDEMDVPNHRTLGQRYGFTHNVGTRHTSAIAASYKLPHTEIYVLSQESGAIRGFHKGKIMYSPHKDEVECLCGND